MRNGMPAGLIDIIGSLNRQKVDFTVTSEVQIEEEDRVQFYQLLDKYYSIKHSGDQQAKLELIQWLDSKFPKMNFGEVPMDEIRFNSSLVMFPTVAVGKEIQRTGQDAPDHSRH